MPHTIPLSKMMLETAERYERKLQAERAVIEAAVAWRESHAGFTAMGGCWLEYAPLVDAIDHLIALG